MAATTRERQEFIATLSRERPDLPSHQIAYLGRKVLRMAATLQRLAEAQCNGDYPCDNGERKVEWCGRCQAGMVRSAMKRCRVVADTAGVDMIGEGTDAYYYLCIDCRTADRLTALLKYYAITPIFQGDPRGCVVKLKVPSGRTDDVAREGICVPS